MPEPLTAADLCTRTAVTGSRTMGVSEAARLMREQHVGCLIVVDETTDGLVPVGVLTDRDIVTAIVAEDLDPRTLRVEDVMSSEPAVAQADDSVLDALAAMRSRGVRRLPVVDARGALLGVLALGDVLEGVVEQLDALRQALASGRSREMRCRPGAA
jgi:CBS domain-containing protein